MRTRRATTARRCVHTATRFAGVRSLHGACGARCGDVWCQATPRQGAGTRAPDRIAWMATACSVQCVACLRSASLGLLLTMRHVRTVSKAPRAYPRCVAAVCRRCAPCVGGGRRWPKCVDLVWSVVDERRVSRPAHVVLRSAAFGFGIGAVCPTESVYVTSAQHDGGIVVRRAGVPSRGGSKPRGPEAPHERAHSRAQGPSLHALVATGITPLHAHQQWSQHRSTSWRTHAPMCGQRTTCAEGPALAEQFSTSSPTTHTPVCATSLAGAAVTPNAL